MSTKKFKKIDFYNRERHPFHEKLQGYRSWTWFIRDKEEGYILDEFQQKLFKDKKTSGVKDMKQIDDETIEIEWCDGEKTIHKYEI